MAYVDPRLPFFDGFPTARGPGVHGDEADSALRDLRRKLSRGAALRLAQRAQDADAGAARRNPPDDDDDGEEFETRLAIVQHDEAAAMGKLITGQWGVDGRNLRRSLAILPNPIARRDDRPFFDRMEELAARLAQQRVVALERYARLGKPGGAWLPEIDKMARAVAFVLSQRDAAQRGIVAAPGGPGGGLLGVGKWGVLAAKGNKKLPFVAYSELPMATCPGAGSCGVPEDAAARAAQKRAGNAWCYSFKAWRYPTAYSRQFLNTLANYADREFAIVEGGGPRDPLRYEERVNAAMAGARVPGFRVWPQLVKGLVLRATRNARGAGRGRWNAPTSGTAFLRLFVDGDINTEDCILEWMAVCRDIGPGGRDIGAGHGAVEVYGYSKCWQQFVNVDGALRTDAERARGAQGQWPANYTLNLSTGSVYTSPGTLSIRERMESLPVTRGYFDAVALHKYIPVLERATLVAQDGTLRDIESRVRAAKGAPFAFDAKRIRTFLLLNGASTPEAVERALGFRVFERDGATGAIKPVTAVEVRKEGYRAFLSTLLKDPAFGRLTREEIARDRGFKADGGVSAEAQYLADVAKRNQARVERALAGGDAKQTEAYTERLLHDKGLALALHEVLWAFGEGGSCPLVCGSCSDHPTDVGAHRCASKTTFRGQHIRIGLH